MTVEGRTKASGMACLYKAGAVRDTALMQREHVSILRPTASTAHHTNFRAACLRQTKDFVQCIGDHNKDGRDPKVQKGFRACPEARRLRSHGRSQLGDAVCISAYLVSSPTLRCCQSLQQRARQGQQDALPPATSSKGRATGNASKALFSVLEVTP